MVKNKSEISNFFEISSNQGYIIPYHVFGNTAGAKICLVFTKKDHRLAKIRIENFWKKKTNIIINLHLNGDVRICFKSIDNLEMLFDKVEGDKSQIDLKDFLRKNKDKNFLWETCYNLYNECLMPK